MLAGDYYGMYISNATNVVFRCMVACPKACIARLCEARALMIISTRSTNLYELSSFYHSSGCSANCYLSVLDLLFIL